MVIPGDEFGHYNLLSELGHGGMGEVWRARDTRTDREVALKILGAWLEGDDKFAARFRRESAHAARLTSPHIVPIHGFGEIDGQLYLDMPLIEGSDLAALIARGPLPAVRAVELITQVANALDTAHRAGLVHRDVKPSNVLVADNGGEDHAYLIDFGIAIAVEDTRITRSGDVIGTLAYMAPERFAGEGDHRSDLYALGCVLYEALTGQRPFPGTSPLILLNAHQNIEPPRPSASRANLPLALDAVISQAMAKDPEQRFGAGAALAAAARAALPSRPAALPAPSTHTSDVTGLTNIVSAAALPSNEGVAPASFTLPLRRRRGRAVLAALTVLALLTAVIIAVVTLNTAATPSKQTLTGHTGSTLAVATAQLNGRPVAISGSEDTTVRVWDLASGTPIGQPLTGHTSYVEAVTTATLDRRTVIISASNDGTIRVWDLATGALVGAPITDHTGSVDLVATAQLHGRLVIISVSDGENLRVWDLATGALLEAPFTGDTNFVYSLATAQLDGRAVIVLGRLDGTIGLWDLATGAPIGTPFSGHTGRVWDLATAQLDGRTVIIAGGEDQTVRVWDLATGTPIGKPLTDHTDVYRVTTAQLDGRTVIIAGGQDHTVRVWDLATGIPAGAPITDNDRVNTVATAQLDGRPVIIAGSSDGTVRVWDLPPRASS